MMRGQIVKVAIRAYEDRLFSKKVRNSKGVFVAQLNPTRFARGYKVFLEDKQEVGNSMQTGRYLGKESSSLKMDFLFDSTGAVPLPGGDLLPTSLGGKFGGKLNRIAGAASEYVDQVGNRGLVMAQLKWLKKIVLEPNDNTHELNYLKIIWGLNLAFKCRLSSMDVEYQLFSPEGFPTRAKASCSFLGTEHPEFTKQKEKKNSTDITHIETVQEGDTLPLMAKRIYGDERYYLEIAKANNLLFFRDLQVGQKIMFPPVKRV